MNDEKQRIAIAEACGWHRRSIDYGDYDSTTNVMMWCCNGIEPQHQLPDYLNDLNAMHEAEKILGASQEVVWINHLWKIVDPQLRQGWEWRTILIAKATAAQRAKALLQTIEKWEDEPERMNTKLTCPQ